MVYVSRLFRMLKIIKEKNKFLRYLNEVFKLSSGLERFIGSIFLLIMICHLAACLWFLQADIVDDPSTWIFQSNLTDGNNFEVIFLLKNLIYFN